MKIHLLIKSIFLVFIFNHQALAYFSTIDTGEILSQDKYRASAETQFLTSSGSGLNVNGRFDLGINEESNLRALVGLGSTDFHTGVFYKWIPIPDYENQPAIGFLAGPTFAHWDGESYIGARVHPIVSKAFDTEIGVFTPYGSIPFGLVSGNDETFVPVQLTLGSEFKAIDLQNIRFFAELGFDLNKSFSYISFAATLYFDDSGQVEFR